MMTGTMAWTSPAVNAGTNLGRRWSAWWISRHPRVNANGQINVGRMSSEGRRSANHTRKEPEE